MILPVSLRAQPSLEDTLKGLLVETVASPRRTLGSKKDWASGQVAGYLQGWASGSRTLSSGEHVPSVGQQPCSRGAVGGSRCFPLEQQLSVDIPPPPCPLQPSPPPQCIFLSLLFGASAGLGPAGGGWRPPRALTGWTAARRLVPGFSRADPLVSQSSPPLCFATCVASSPSLSFLSLQGFWPRQTSAHHVASLSPLCQPLLYTSLWAHFLFL